MLEFFAPICVNVKARDGKLVIPKNSYPLNPHLDFCGSMLVMFRVPGPTGYPVPSLVGYPTRPNPVELSKKHYLTWCQVRDTITRPGTVSKFWTRNITKIDILLKK